MENFMMWYKQIQTNKYKYGWYEYMRDSHDIYIYVAADAGVCKRIRTYKMEEKYIMSNMKSTYIENYMIFNKVE